MSALWADLSPTERDAAIRGLHGMSASAMAEHLGTTKGAVAGHAWRRKVPVVEAARSRIYVPAPANDNLPPVPSETWAPLGVPVSDPTRRQCCWPVGEASGSAQMFCGLPRHKGSYCTTHAAMASGRRPTDLPYVDMLRAAPVPAEVTIEEAVALVLPARKVKLEGAE